MLFTSGQDPALPRPCGAANPEETNLDQVGMTMREWYAGMALPGIIAAYTGDHAIPSSNEAARWAFEYADAMLAESRRLHDEQVMAINARRAQHPEENDE